MICDGGAVYESWLTARRARPGDTAAPRFCQRCHGWHLASNVEPVPAGPGHLVSFSDAHGDTQFGVVAMSQDDLVGIWGTTASSNSPRRKVLVSGGLGGEDIWVVPTARTVASIADVTEDHGRLPDDAMHRCMDVADQVGFATVSDLRHAFDVLHGPIVEGTVFASPLRSGRAAMFLAATPPEAGNGGFVAIRLASRAPRRSWAAVRLKDWDVAAGCPTPRVALVNESHAVAVSDVTAVTGRASTSDLERVLRRRSSWNHPSRVRSA